MSSSSSAPCAACKVQRRKCIQECIFAPYFPPDHPEKFIMVHKVFGASNVAKILNELPACQREDAVNSLTFEADARLKDPVYGCVGVISVLEEKLRKVKNDLYNHRLELAQYIGPSAMVPIFHPAGFVHQYPHGNPASSPGLMPYNMAAAAAAASMAGVPTGTPHAGQQMLMRDPKVHQPHPHLRINQHVQHIETQQLSAAEMAIREELEMMRTFEQQQQHQQQQQHVLNHHHHGQQQQQLIMRLDAGGYELGSAPYPGVVVAEGGGGRFDDMGGSAIGVSPSLALAARFDNPYQVHQQQQEHQDTLLILQQPQQPHTEVGLSTPHQAHEPLQYTRHDQKLEEHSPGSDEGGILGHGPC
ncbi:hypothetical protein Dimus_017106 [Dionaea muscipula]